MPRLMATEDDQVITVPGPGNYQFSAVRMEKLGATEYSLITLVLDRSGSTEQFEKDLLNLTKTVVESCKSNPRSENLLFRYLIFNESITEVHGFKLLSTLDVDQYDELDSDGMTALFDATYDAVGATLTFSEELVKQDYDVNGAVYIVTDGLNNRGTATPTMIKDKIQEALRQENVIESMLTILIGLHDSSSGWSDEVEVALDEFKDVANLDAYISAGEATPKNLAKLGNFISQSISSTSQNLGTGLKSQQLTF
jgi:hypothetical protein